MERHVYAFGVVSKYLTIERAVDENGQQIFDAEYYGYDDKRTEDTSDDDHLYFIRWYVLKDSFGRDASSGEVWLYDPDFVRVRNWAVPSLYCTEHEGFDGLEADPNGLLHGVIVNVPVSAMEKAGTYRFVLHFYDDYADSYKNHKVKAALERNSIPASLQFTVSTDPDGSSQAGHPSHRVGMRDTIKFYGIIKATLVWPGKPSFETIGFLLIRSKTGEKMRKTGYLITDTNDPDGPKDIGGGLKRWTFRTHKTATDKGVTDLIVTKMKGRWEIKVSPHKSNTVWFKVDKREQIVITAESWVGAIVTSARELCSDFVERVYRHVNIPVNGDTVSALRGSTTENKEQDSKHAAIVFYGRICDPSGWGHAAIRVMGGKVIDANCDLADDPRKVSKHLEDEHLPKRHIKDDRTPKELIDLDGE